MKKKILMIILLGFIGTILIYKTNKKDEIFFLSLGDGLASGMTAYNIDGYNYNDYIRDELEKKDKLDQFIHEFTTPYQSIENLITCIENNYLKEEINLTIQQALAKAHLLTIGIGLDELANSSLKSHLTSKEKEDYKKDMKKLMKLIRNFNTGKIYLLGIYKAYNLKEEDIQEINDAIKEIAIENQAIYIDISNLATNPDYFLLNSSYYLNYKGHKEISKQILSSL